jgi:hypothetical protein
LQVNEKSIFSFISSVLIFMNWVSVHQGPPNMFHLQDVGIQTMIFAVFRLVAVASGAAAGRFLKYEPGGPGVSVQTAYGVEVEV